MSDPYNALIETMREEGKFHNEPSFFTGTITKSLPDIRIYFNDIEIDKESLMIDKALLDRHNYSISSNTCEINHNLNDILNIGDTVILLKNGNIFIVISKVVSI